MYVMQPSLLIIGIAGTVVALDRATGKEAWRTKLKGYDFVNVSLQAGDVYATAMGEIYCLDSATGQVRWTNELKGLGHGLIAIAGADNQGLLRERKSRDDSESAITA
jgi:hypothetical protein